MLLLKPSQIQISKNRQRREFDPEAIMDLHVSIINSGLLHAPVVREEGDSYVLVCGERRLRAIEELYEFGETFVYAGVPIEAGMVPCVTVGELDPLEAWEAELDENIRRKDLTWQERAAATDELLRLRQAQAAQKAAETREEVKPPTHSDIAQELVGVREGGPAARIRRDLIVAKHLEDPEIAKAKTVDDAFKILKRREEQRDNETRAKGFEGLEREMWTLLQGNCLDLMRGGLPYKFDVILTDPPYGIGADAFGDAAGKLLTIDHNYHDDRNYWMALMSEWVTLAFESAATQAHAYVFCDIDNFSVLRGMMEGAGWRVFRTPLIVHKINSGRVPWPEHGPRRSWEAILYAVKGDKPVNYIAADVIPCRGDDNLGHGAQKPVELYVDLLKRSCRPGDRVLDTFAGTGTIFAAAKECKVFATGIEQDSNAVGIILKRLEELK